VVRERGELAFDADGTGPEKSPPLAAKDG